MPWNVRKRGKKWCVIKVGESSPVPGGCHDKRQDAVRHQRALYAGENSNEHSLEVLNALLSTRPGGGSDGKQ